MTNYIALILTLMIGIISVMKDYDHGNKRKKFFDWILFSALVTLTAVSAFIQYNTDIDHQEDKELIHRLENQNSDQTKDFQQRTDSLQNKIADLKATDIFKETEKHMSFNAENYSETTGLLGDFCYAILIPRGDGTYTFGINNPFNFKLKNVHLQIIPYNKISTLRTKDVQGQKLYSMHDYRYAQIFHLHEVDLKPGATILNQFPIPINLPINEVAGFEVNFSIDKGNKYTEQLAVLLSDDHINLVNSLALYKTTVKNNLFMGIHVKHSLPPPFDAEKWHKMFPLQPVRQYYDDDDEYIEEKDNQKKL